MKALLDTMAFIWHASADPRLSPRARSVIDDRANELFLSAASAWEIAIKYSLGKLEIDGEPDVYIPAGITGQGLTPLAITIEHAITVSALPGHHRDPFDRLLIAQAQVERLPIITGDPNIARYDVEVIW